jgi:hypothetical protein
MATELPSQFFKESPRRRESFGRKKVLAKSLKPYHSSIDRMTPKISTKTLQETAKTNHQT